jgi:O-acetyl-ADP-ribose deacetylase (regulator of RNase III)
MALIILKGDLLKSDCDVIAHQANCYSRMGAGIAKQIVQKWPVVAVEDRNFHITSPSKRLGQFSYAFVEQNTVMVCNLYGQLNYGTGAVQTNYAALESSIRLMMDFLKQSPVFKSKKIGFPFRLGCGLAGGDWAVVSKILNRISEEYDVDLYAYSL